MMKFKEHSVPVKGQSVLSYCDLRFNVEVETSGFVLCIIR
jgi:hypothetical protein